MERVIRMVMADAHKVMRAGIRELLSDKPDSSVGGEARDGHEAVALTLAERPDIRCRRT